MTPLIRALLPLAALCTLCASCSSEPSERPESPVEIADTRDEPPGDFTLSVVVYSTAPSTPTTAPARRPARYIVEPDWLLRAAVGPGCTETTYPAGVRQLTRAELGELWKLCQSAGLTSDNTEGRLRSPTQFDAPTRGTTYLISVTESQHRRTFAFETGATAPQRKLIEQLAKLSWQSK
jgi:hypothetical protein